MAKIILFALGGALAALGLLTLFMVDKAQFGWGALLLGGVSGLSGLGLFLLETKQLAGFVQVPEDERGVIEWYGRYSRILRPGKAWLIPGVEKVRARVPVSQQTIPLLDDDKHPNSIDFDDAAATVIGAAAQVEVMNPDTSYDAGDGKFLPGAYRVIYGHDDWRALVKDLVGNALRSYLSSLASINIALRVRGGYNVARKGPDGIPDDRLDELDKKLSEVGIRLKGVTIQDFQTSKRFQEARESRSQAVAETDAVLERTIGMAVRIMGRAEGLTEQEMQQRIAGNPELKAQVVAAALELLKLERALDKGAYTAISTSGGGGMEDVFTRLVALWKK